MIPTEEVVNLSRLQFGLTAMYHFLFVPLTLGLLAGVWLLIAASLNYGLTLQLPTTQCRRCRYELGAHIKVVGPSQDVRCPECGARWTSTDLGLAA